MTDLLPTRPDARVELIDIVRGFALFGVMLANMVWVAYGFALTDAQQAALPTAGLDRLANRAVLFLVDFKFYTLFAMLFGLGFALQLTRAAERGRTILPVYVRRLAILFALGVAHALLLWFGDILHMYALVGFILILFRRHDDRVLLGWAVGIAAFVALMPALQWVLVSAGFAPPEAASDPNEEVENFRLLMSGNWSDVVRINWAVVTQDYMNRSLGFDGTLYLYFSVLWKFLLGFVMGRRMLLQDWRKHLAFFRRLFLWALPIGLAGNALMLFLLIHYHQWIGNMRSPRALAMIPIEIGMFALSMAYLSGIVLLYTRPAWQKRLVYLAPVGRMALTNYLSQSVFLVVLFYGVGFGLLGKVGAAACVVLCILLFALQIGVSNWWLRRARFGPAEWVWRSLTYGRLQPFRATA
ncbi:MAG: DUF418 domain-containing protein [Woeseiaceae bacterium]